MKKIFLLFMGLVLFSDYAFADKNIELKTNESPVSVSQNQIPINATQSSTAIDILFLKGAVYKVIVTGAEGIVYQNEITVKLNLSFNNIFLHPLLHGEIIRWRILILKLLFRLSMMIQVKFFSLS